LFKRKNYSKNSFDPSLFLFLLLLFFLSLFSFFNLHQIFKETWKKKKLIFFLKKKETQIKKMAHPSRRENPT